jgi:hypothetical protein
VSEIDDYNFRVRERLSAAHIFSDLLMFEYGYVICEDDNGMSEWYDFYDAQRVYDIMFMHNLDAGTYDFWFDGQKVIDDRAHGVIGAGIGTVIAGCHNDADLDGALHIDNLYVGISVPEDRLVCCVDEACGVVIPMDCAYRAGELHPEWESCTPNYCSPGGVARLDERPDGLRLRVRPNPAGERVSLVYRLPDGHAGHLTIHDVAGRLVRRLPRGAGLRGQGVVVWDRCREDGSRSGTGVYFARLNFGGGDTVQRLIVLE